MEGKPSRRRASSMSGMETSWLDVLDELEQLERLEHDVWVVETATDLILFSSLISEVVFGSFCQLLAVDVLVDDSVRLMLPALPALNGDCALPTSDNSKNEIVIQIISWH